MTKTILRAALIVLAAKLTVAGAAAAQPKKQAAPGLDAAAQRIVVRALSALLLDPTDAKYQWPPFLARAGKGPRPYCGVVNARNAMGQYAGDRVFLAYLTLNRGRVVRATIYGIADRNPTNPVTVAVTQRCQAAGYKYQPDGQ